MPFQKDFYLIISFDPHNNLRGGMITSLLYRSEPWEKGQIRCREELVNIFHILPKAPEYYYFLSLPSDILINSNYSSWLLK